MMDEVCFVGDERAAAGWRLAVAAVRTPRHGEEAAVLQAARADAALVLLASTVAAALPEATLRAATAALSPLVLVLPDPDGAVPVPDIAARLRTQLGMQS